MKKAREVLLGLFFCGALCSCASVSVQKTLPLSDAPPSQAPQRIFVQPFTFDEPGVRVNREGKELENFQANLQDEMAKNLVTRLRKYIAPAEILHASAGTPQGDAWLVTGQFTKVNQGSRFLRSAFGFGSGGTKMNVSVTVSDLSGETARPLVNIETTGGSNAMPGAVMGVITWPMILMGSNGLISGVSGDCRRTSREITAAISDYMKSHGLTVATDAPKPKEKGKVDWWPWKKEAE